MSDSPDPPQSPGDVGAALAWWRKRRKISGQVLGRRVGMSQAKISRLETGVSTPDPEDVRRIAESLDLPSAEVERLASLAEQSEQPLIDWQAAEPNLTNRQEIIKSLEALVREVRVFQPAVVPGLLQTSEYARSVLKSFRFEVGENELGASELAISEAVAERMARGQALYKPDRQFHFLLAETVLTTMVCEPLDMLGQIKRLREVAALPNVTVKFIRHYTRWPVPPLNGFELMGDRAVMVDTVNSSLVSRADRQVVQQHRRIFEALESVATTDIGPVMDAHQDRYLQMLRSAVA
ncbi:transcriptional regulator [Paractinoplanes abujensis]|uniref:Transcriptional regulator with XRE-family HTH domain n=1 Tax=Paractinoplanes abujensis TaxID=882441 RepID=A0A7W7CTN6_9ACTN|nr:helix-turn-helix transcriptional regulator [Actinoplanes abujensis]MBB4694483.1 transcriptional regulator with XRE-family HTH domain [Actinoplanes abujensis]GID20303.1 transcriptional regulator [Actinoplanes abujensis]